MRVNASCLKSVLTCTPQRKAREDFIQFERLDSDQFPFPFDPSDMGIEVIVIGIGPDGRGFSFSPPEATAKEDNRPPLKLANEKYDVTLNVSHAYYDAEYRPFQAHLLHMGSMIDANALNTILAEKPAAFSVATGPDFTAPRPNIADPVSLFMALGMGRNMPLAEAVRFSSEAGDAFFPTCQLMETFRNRRLFNTITGELLTGKEFRQFQDSYRQDIEKQPPVKAGQSVIRSVPR